MRPRPLALLALVLWATESEAHALEGRAYVSLDGQVGVARGEMGQRLPGTNPGWDFRFGVGLRGIPLTLGLGASALTYSSQSWDGGSRGLVIRDGDIGFGPTTWVRTAEMRHFDVVLRLQPEWRRARPFVEVSAGTAQFFIGQSLSTDWQGLVLESSEASRPLAFAWGWGAGLEVEPWRIYSGPEGTLGLAISVGVRGRRSLPAEYAVPSRDPQGALVAARTALDMVAPFVGVAIVSRSARGRR
jgi:hypothetical protein